jgi:hypothetical protein
MDITSWIIFVYFKYILIALDFTYSIIFNYLNVWSIFVTKYIIFIIKFEIWIYTSKLRLWMELLGEFFYGVWYWYTSIKSKRI